MSSYHRFRLGHKASPVSATLLLVACIGGILGFIALQQYREAREQRLRFLASFADRVELALTGITERFRRIVTEQEHRELEIYLSQVPFVELVESSSAGEQQSGLQSQAEQQNGQNSSQSRDGGAIERIGKELHLKRHGRAVYLDYRSEVEPVDESSDGRRLSGSADAKDDVAGALARIDLPSVIEPMVIPGVFDSVLIADRRGRVLFQQGKPELRVADLRTLLDRPDSGSSSEVDSPRNLLAQRRSESRRGLPQNSESSDAWDDSSIGLGGSTNLVAMNVSGSDHSVFLQPIQLRLEPLAGEVETEPVRWVAVGVVGNDRILSSGVTTSPILLSCLLGLIPLGIIALPFLKLSLISPREGFTRFDLVWLLVASFLALSLGALLLVALLFSANLFSIVDEQLVELSSVIQRELRFEVLDAYRQLRHLDEGVDLYELSSFSLAPYSSTREIVTERVIPYLTVSGSPSVETYPHFDSVFWPDDRGEIHDAVLPLSARAVLPQNVADRRYFQCARERDWTESASLVFFEGEHRRYLESRGLSVREGARLGELSDDVLTITVCLESILDRLTGEAVAAIALPSSHESESRPVAAMKLGPPSSLSHAVLDQNTNFAVLDGSGRSLFRSDHWGTRTRDLLTASDEERLLRFLIRSRREGSLTFRYWGRPHRAHVSPIHGLPWSVVTFRRTEDIRFRTYELVHGVLNLVLLELAFLLVFAVGFKFLAPRRFLSYLWPSSRHLSIYAFTILWTVVALGLSCGALALELPRLLSWFSCLMIPVSVLLVFVVLPHLRQAPTVRATSGPYKASGEIDADSRHLPWRALNRLWVGLCGIFGGRYRPDLSQETRWHRMRSRRRVLAALCALETSLVVMCLWGLGWSVLPVFTGALFVSTLIGVWWNWGEFAGSRRKVAYIFALSCFFVVSFLPVLGFVHLARSQQTQFLVQDSELSLARRIAGRESEMEAAQGPVVEAMRGTSSLYNSYEGVLACTREAYLGAIFDTSSMPRLSGGLSWCPVSDPQRFSALQWQSPRWGQGWRAASAGSRSELPSTNAGVEGVSHWVNRFLSARLLPFESLLGRRWLEVESSWFPSSSARWKLASGSNNKDAMRLDFDQGFDTGRPLTLVSQIPATDDFDRIPLLHSLFIALGLTTLATGTVALAWFIADRVLLINLVYYGGSRQPDGVSGGFDLRPADSVEEILKDVKRRRRSGTQLIVAQDLPEVRVYSEGFHSISFRKAWQEAETECRRLEEEGEGREDAPASRAQLFQQILRKGEKASEGGDRRPILLTDFEPDDRDPRAAADQTDALRALTEEGRSLVIVAVSVPLRESPGAPSGWKALHDLIQRVGGRRFETDEDDAAELKVAAAHAAARRRWANLLECFSVRYAKARGDRAQFRRVVEWLQDRPERSFFPEGSDGESLPTPADLDHWSRIVGLVGEECVHTRTLRSIGRHVLRDLFRGMREEPRAGEGGRSVPDSKSDETLQLRSALTLLTQEHIITRIETEAELHYRNLWTHCTKDEKVVLVQLAEHGLVNPKSFRWVMHLMNRGLVVRSPDLRIMNKSFERFVREEVDRSQVREWQKETGLTGWGAFKWLLPLPLLLLAGFLFITQRDTATNAAAVLVALASLAPWLLNLYGKFQEVNVRRSQQEAGE